MKIEMPNVPHRAVAETAEGKRLTQADSATGTMSWRRFGPYISDRQWGTVREDYSADGEAWTYLPHDQARSKAYRWGEDAIAGFADDKLHVCLGLALWNGDDPILKERLFGLTNSQGNHGEDVKELYYYVDGTPTHSYMRMIYKYPQDAFPYEDLIETNAKRSLTEREYEVIDTGLFDQDRYFDVTVEYAKATPDDVLMLVTIANRGDAEAPLHVLPQLWSRNTWTWGGDIAKRPKLAADGAQVVTITHPDMPAMRFDCDGMPELLFCDNETNLPKLYGVKATGFFKDGINDHVVDGVAGAVNPARTGTKAAAHYAIQVPAHGEVTLRLRLRPAAAVHGAFTDYDATMQARRDECGAFYAALQVGIDDADARQVQRQAFAGMLWSKQYYGFDIRQWLNGDPAEPRPPHERLLGRDSDWMHFGSDDIFSMPDAWEYPWFAAWDLAFQCMTVRAWSTPTSPRTQLWCCSCSRAVPAPQRPDPGLRVGVLGDTQPAGPCAGQRSGGSIDMDRIRSGRADRDLAASVVYPQADADQFHLVGKQGRQGFEGPQRLRGGIPRPGQHHGRSTAPGSCHEGGSTIEQSDATGWMGMFYALNLMRIALELARWTNKTYEALATKFFQHLRAGGRRHAPQHRFATATTRSGTSRTASIYDRPPLSPIRPVHGSSASARWSA